MGHDSRDHSAAAGHIVTRPRASRAVGFRFAADLHGPSDTLDPALFTSSVDYLRGRSYYNNLIRLSDDIKPGPELAEEFSSNPTATEWTFKLRQGVTWHDGSPFTADDVIYTMNRHSGKDSVSKVKSLVSMVKTWKKVDKHTVKAELDSPNADLAAILGTFHFKVIKNGTQGADFQRPVGTGPFKVKTFTPGVRSVGVRNDNYWGDGRPYVDEIHTFGITDTVARINALLSGDVDLIQNVDPKAIKQVEAAPDYGVWSVPSGAYMDIVCMLDKTPGNNPDFVLALKYLQQREKMVKRILKGHGTVGNDHPISPAYPDHCADLPIRVYDPEKAKFHLKKSGVTRAEIQVAEVGSGLVDVVLMLQREAARIGLTIDVKRVPNDGYWGAVWMKTPVHVAAWNMRPTAGVMLSIAYAPDAPWNESQWKSERMGTLLSASRAELDPAKRAEMFCDMQRMISEEAGTIIPVHRNYVDGKANKVQGITRQPLASMGGLEWPEYAWIDA